MTDKQRISIDSIKMIAFILCIVFVLGELAYIGYCYHSSLGYFLAGFLSCPVSFLLWCIYFIIRIERKPLPPLTPTDQSGTMGE